MKKKKPPYRSLFSHHCAFHLSTTAGLWICLCVPQISGPVRCTRVLVTFPSGVCSATILGRRMLGTIGNCWRGTRMVSAVFH